MQSSLLHVGVIMDGNRRWARERRLPTTSGHRAGFERLVDLVPCLQETEIEVLTVYAFSADNWQRPKREVEQIFSLACEGFERFTPTCVEQHVRVEVIGRRDRLPSHVVRAAERITCATAKGKRVIRVALDYSGRQSLVRAAAAVDSNASVESFSHALNRAQHSKGPYRDLDLIIRTGKEQRLSDFMLWECAYAELYFPDLYWPDFTPDEFRRALACYHTRSRRFGG
jgi:undecaprenyl diphosphate synthase